jgi:hypothetical protein
MRVRFLSDTKDLREGKTGTHKKNSLSVVADKFGKQYIDKGFAIDANGKYFKKIKAKKDGR